MGGISPLKCVMIGDDIERDMLGGFIANMQIILYNPLARNTEIIFLFRSLRPVPMIKEMHHLITCLKNLGYCN